MQLTFTQSDFVKIIYISILHKCALFSVIEVPTDTADTNPLLRYANSGTPELAIVSEENCYNGLGKALLEYESAVFRFAFRVFLIF